MLVQRGLVLVGLIGCGCIGCSTVSPPGAAVGVPSGGPALVAPGGSASLVPPPGTSTSDTASQIVSPPGSFGRGGQLTPAGSRPDRLRGLLRPAAPRPLERLRQEQTPFHLISERRMSDPVGGAPILTLDALESQGPLATVVTPRKQREQKADATPVPLSKGIRQTDMDPPRPAPSSILKGWSDSRIRRLPPVFESARDVLNKLPQSPMPNYPEVRPSDRKAREDL